MASILLYILLAHVCAIIGTCQCHETTPKFPAILIFGDSTVDPGNNNYITTLFTANHQPYGVDFPDHVSTGRFSDGRLVPDFLAAGLGIKQSVPSFLQPSLSNDQIRTGVSFASAGSGFDELTTAVSGVIPVSRQPDMFKRYIIQLKGIVGNEEAAKIINNSLILISAGTNDFVFNWYDIPTRRIFFNWYDSPKTRIHSTIQEYQDFLLQKLQSLIEQLYTMGGRKFMVVGLGPIGCVPFQITASSWLDVITAKFKNLLDRTCIGEQNTDSVVYNGKLKKRLPKIQASLAGSKLVYGNTYDLVMDMINRPHKFGFTETNKGCCGTGYFEVAFLCNPSTPTCTNASQYLFWDAVHPSEAAYRLVADNLLKNVIPQLS